MSDPIGCPTSPFRSTIRPRGGGDDLGASRPRFGGVELVGFFRERTLLGVEIPRDLGHARLGGFGHLLAIAEFGLRRLEVPAGFFIHQLGSRALVVEHRLALIGLIQAIVFAAGADGVGLGARSFEARRDDHALELVHAPLRVFEISSRGLLVGFESSVGDSGEQLAFKDLLADLGEERSENSFDRRHYADHLLGADLSDQIDIAHRRDRLLRDRLRGLCLEGASAQQDRHAGGDQSQQHDGRHQNEPFAAHKPMIAAPDWAILVRMTSFSLRRMGLLFLRVGNLTFGGGDPTMAALQRELVVSREWISPGQYALIFGLARATPGTNLLAFCTGVGWQLARWRGALLALLAASIPCAAAVVWFTYVYTQWVSNPLAMAAIGGMLAAAVGMMTAAGFQLVRAGWKPGNRLRAVTILAAGFWLSYGLSVPPIQVLGLGALAGLIWR